MPRGKIDRSVFKVKPIHERNFQRNAEGKILVTDNFDNSLSTRCPKESV